MRGEHIIYSCHIAILTGSSPHAWGTFQVPDTIGAASRFIPTCVGNILAASQEARHPSVHPHMRGEHLNIPVYYDIADGSSPHAWGTYDRHDLVEEAARFIPTCVGNIPERRPRYPHLSVHPHMRGEHPHPSLASLATIGSSPHAWGTCKVECRIQG